MQLTCRTEGILFDCMRFYDCRIVLNCDHFPSQSACFQEGEVGGCYMMPIGLSLKVHQCVTSFIAISLTLMEVSTSMILVSSLMAFYTLVQKVQTSLKRNGGSM